MIDESVPWAGPLPTTSEKATATPLGALAERCTTTAMFLVVSAEAAYATTVVTGGGGGVTSPGGLMRTVAMPVLPLGSVTLKTKLSSTLSAVAGEYTTVAWVRDAPGGVVQVSGVHPGGSPGVGGGSCITSPSVPWVGAVTIEKVRSSFSGSLPLRVMVRLAAPLVLTSCGWAVGARLEKKLARVMSTFGPSCTSRARKAPVAWAPCCI